MLESQLNRLKDSNTGLNNRPVKIDLFASERSRSLPDLNNIRKFETLASTIPNPPNDTIEEAQQVSSNVATTNSKNTWKKFNLNETQYKLIQATIPKHKRNIIQLNESLTLSDLMKHSLSTKKIGQGNERDDLYVFNNRIQKKAYDLDQTFKECPETTQLPSKQSLSYACAKFSQNVAKEHKNLESKKTAIKEYKSDDTSLLIKDYFKRMEEICKSQCHEKAYQYLKNKFFTFKTTERKASEIFEEDYLPHINTLKEKLNSLDMEKSTIYLKQKSIFFPPSAIKESNILPVKQPPTTQWQEQQGQKQRQSLKIKFRFRGSSKTKKERQRIPAI